MNNPHPKYSRILAIIALTSSYDLSVSLNALLLDKYQLVYFKGEQFLSSQLSYIALELAQR